MKDCTFWGCNPFFVCGDGMAIILVMVQSFFEEAIIFCAITINFKYETDFNLKCNEVTTPKSGFRTPPKTKAVCPFKEHTA